MKGTKKIFGLLTWVIISALAMSCGGSDAGSFDCNTLNFTACGGDVTGVWEFTGGCMIFTENPWAEQCPDIEVEVKMDVTGEVELKSDNSYTVDVTMSNDITLLWPASCLRDAVCADLPSDDMTCTDINGDCSCSLTGQPPENIVETGTWVASGGTLTMSQDGATEPDVMEFCIDGSEFVISQEVDDAQQMYMILKKK